jgi:hypothetical protein
MVENERPPTVESAFVKPMKNVTQNRDVGVATASRTYPLALPQLALLLGWPEMCLAVLP